MMVYNVLFFVCLFVFQMEIFQGACEGGHLNIVKLLFENGWSSVKALQICCEKGNLRMAKLVYEMGPNFGLKEVSCFKFGILDS